MSIFGNFNYWILKWSNNVSSCNIWVWRSSVGQSYMGLHCSKEILVREGGLWYSTSNNINDQILKWSHRFQIPNKQVFFYIKKYRRSNNYRSIVMMVHFTDLDDLKKIPQNVKQMHWRFGKAVTQLARSISARVLNTNGFHKSQCDMISSSPHG